MGGQYKASLFGCCSYPLIAAKVCCCLPAQIAMNSWTAQPGEELACCSGCVRCTTGCCTCGPPSPPGPAWTRDNIRTLRGKAHGVHYWCDDATAIYCCYPCVVCQDAREIEDILATSTVQLPVAVRRLIEQPTG